MDEQITELLQNPDRKAALKKLAISSDGETADIMFGYSIELYFESGWETEKRKAMANVVFQYADLFPNEVNFYHPRNSSRLKKITTSEWKDYFLKLAETVSPDNAEGFDATVYGFPGGKEEDTATPYFCVCIGAPRDKRYSRVHAYLPIDWTGNGGDYNKLVDLMKRWCGELRVSHGTAGLSVIFEEGQNKSRAALMAYPFLKRFPGLDYPNASRWSSNVRRADRRFIRSTNWLTAIDDGFAEELGGKRKIEGALDESCSIVPYSGGLIIQAGPQPEIGDNNRGIELTHYRSVANLLKPLRFEDFRPTLPYIHAPSPADSLDETRKWLARFDGKQP